MRTRGMICGTASDKQIKEWIEQRATPKKESPYVVLLPDDSTDLTKYNQNQAIIEKVKLIQTPDYKTEVF